MLGGNIPFTLERDDLGTPELMLPRGFDGLSNGREEHAWRHDPLDDAVIAVALANVEQPALIGELRRLLNKGRNVDVIERHTQLSPPIATRHEPGIGRLFSALINRPVNGQELTTRVNAGRSA